MRRRRIRRNGDDGSTIQMEREGFTEADQARAVYECKVAQWSWQAGRCVNCDFPIRNPSEGAWVNANGHLSLGKWWKEKNVTPDLVQLVHVSRHRSPDEIKEYYKTTSGHDLVHYQCAPHYNNKRYGYAGEGRAFKNALVQLAKSRGLELDKIDTALYTQLHRETMTRMAERRDESLAEARERGHASLKRKNPDWGKGRKYHKHRGRARFNQPADRPNVPVAPVVQRVPEVDNLALEREWEDTRPETELEQQARAVWESILALGRTP